MGRVRKQPEVPSGYSTRISGLRPLTVSLQPFLVRYPNDRSGREAGIDPRAGFEALRSLRWPVVGSLVRQLLAVMNSCP